MTIFKGIVFYFLFNILLVNCQLYSEDDNVKIFDPISFANTFSQRPTSSWFVQFYSSFCGHCINFSPKFKEFLKDAKYWGGVVKFGVVDCSQHNILCNEQRVIFYPFFKIFPARRFKDSPLNGIKVSVDHTNLQLFYKTIIYQIEVLLKPSRLIETRPDADIDAAQYFLLIGDDNVNLKRAVLTFSDCLAHPLYYRHDDDSERGFTVTLVNGSSTVTRSVADIAGLYDWLSKYSKEDTDDVLYPPSEESPTNDDLDDDNEEASHIAPPVYNQDIYSSIYYSFLNEISDNDLSSIHNIMILKNFVEKLYLYSDINARITAGCKTLMGLLRVKIDELSSRSEKITRWSDMIRLSKLPVIQPSWIGCNGSLPYLRRYPCGLWTLFHTLTVNHHLKVREGKIDDDSLDLIKSIREFIFTFFKCQECAQNFKSETSDYKSFVTSAPRAVIYLWFVHNSVNKRISGDRSDDPSFPKVSFPTLQSCSTCRFNFKTEWPKSEQWNYLEVLYFLIGHYSYRIPLGTPAAL